MHSWLQKDLHSAAQVDDRLEHQIGLRPCVYGLLADCTEDSPKFLGMIMIWDEFNSGKCRLGPAADLTLIAGRLPDLQPVWF